jgi:hypothetical protein
MTIRSGEGTLAAMTKQPLLSVISLCVALLVGTGLAFLPLSTRNWPESGASGVLRAAINCLAIPGIVVATVVAGNVHLMSLWVLDVSNVVFYSAISFFIVRAWTKHRARVPDSKDRPH